MTPVGRVVGGRQVEPLDGDQQALGDGVAEAAGRSSLARSIGEVR